MIEKIAITGGIAEGKSTILKILNEFGILTFSSDQCVKELYSDPKIQNLLKLKVGCEPTTEKEKFRTTLFTNLEFRQQVESIIHPLVFDKIKESKAHYIEIPLLFEKNINILFKEIWLVTCGRKIQWNRLIKRIHDPDLASRILETQWPFFKKKLLSDQIIYTNKPINQVRKQVESLLRI